MDIAQTEQGTPCIRMRHSLLCILKGMFCAHKLCNRMVTDLERVQSRYSILYLQSIDFPSLALR